MKTIIWTVVFRDSADNPQQELIRYTKEAANAFALSVINNGGVAIVVEGEDEDEGNNDG